MVETLSGTMRVKRAETVDALRAALTAIAGLTDAARAQLFPTGTVLAISGAVDAIQTALGSAGRDTGMLARCLQAHDIAVARRGYIGGGPGRYELTRYDWTALRDQLIATGTSWYQSGTVPTSDDFVGVLLGMAIVVRGDESRYVLDDGERGCTVVELTECPGNVWTAPTAA